MVGLGVQEPVKTRALLFGAGRVHFRSSIPVSLWRARAGPASDRVQAARLCFLRSPGIETSRCQICPVARQFEEIAAARQKPTPAR
jgi:hypothetical protein